MSKFVIDPVVGPRQSKVVLCVFLAAVFSVVVLVAAYYFYVPLRVDGGWYSYPALCLSRGDDPGENYLKIDDLKDKPGIRVIFDVGDDFRRSIRVLPMTLWFMAFGASIWMVKLYGIIEHVILLTIMYLLLRQISRDQKIALLCFAICLMDAPAIWFSSTNLRPDIFITTMALITFLFVRMDDRIDRRLLIFLGGTLSIFLLALTRVSSALPLVLLFSYLIVELCLSWRNLSNFKKWFYVSLIAAGATGYVLRDQLLDVVISSKYSVQHVRHMEQVVYSSMMKRSITRMFLKELSRWSEYFRPSNIGELLAIVLAFCLLGARFCRQAGKTLKWKVLRSEISYIVACLLGIGTLAIGDPLPASLGHGLPIVFFLILLLAREMELVSVPRIKKIAISLLVVIVLVSAGARLTQGIYAAARGIKNGYSIAAVVETMRSTVSTAGRKYVVIGSAELWPYFDPRSNVVLIDQRHKWELDRLSDLIESTDFIIIDKFYVEENWEHNFASRYPGVKLTTIREVGNPTSGWYFLKVTKPSFAGP